MYKSNYITYSSQYVQDARSVLLLRLIEFCRREKSFRSVVFLAACMQ